MAELTLEQQKALAIAQARRRRIEAEGAEPTQGEQGGITPPASPRSWYDLSTEEQAQRMQKSPFESGVGMVGSAVWNAGKNMVQSVAAGHKVVGDYLGDKVDQIENPVAKGVARAGANFVDPVGSILHATGADPAKTIEENVPEITTDNPVTEMAREGTQFGIGMAGPTKGINIQTAQGAAKIIGAITKYALSMAGGSSAVDQDSGNFLTEKAGEWMMGDPEALKIFKDLGSDKEGNYSEELLKKRINIFAEAYLTAKPMELGVRAVGAAGKFIKNDVLDNIFNWKSLPQKEKAVFKEWVNSVRRVEMNSTPAEAAAAMEDVAARLRRGADVNIESTTPGIDSANFQRPTSSAFLEGGPSTREEMASMASMHSAASNRGSGQLATVSSEPSAQLDRVLTQSRDVFGGKQAVDEAKDAALKSGQNEIKNYTDEVARQEGELATRQGNVSQVMKDDEFIGPTVRDAEAGKLDLRKQVNDTADEMVGEHNRFRDDLKEAGDKDFKKVRKNTKYDKKSFMEEYEKVKEFLPADIQAMVEKSNGTYTYLRNNIGTELNAHITDLYATGQSRIANKLKNLKKNIYEVQPNKLEERGANTTSRQYKAAMHKYETEQVPYQQGPGEEIYQIHKNKDTTEKYFGRPDEAAVDMRKIMKRTLDDPDQIEHTRRILSTLKTPELKDKYIVSRVAEELSGKQLKDLDVEAFRRVTRPYAQMMDDGGKRLETLYNSLAAEKGNIDGMKKVLEATRQETADAQRRVFRDELGKFFDNEQGVPMPKDADDAFREYFKTGNLNSIKQLKNRIAESGSHEAQEGLKAAFGDYAKSQLFRSGETAGAKNINEQTLKSIEDGTNKLFKLGDEIYGANSSEMKLIRGLSLEAEKNANLAAGRIAPMTALDAADVQAQNAFNFIITQWRGQLDRFGARMRSTVGRVMSSQSTKEQQLQAIGNVYSNATRAAEIAEQMAREYRGKMTKEFRNRIIDGAVEAGLLTRSQAEEERKDNTIEAFDIDKSRPILENDDGSFSTEETATRQDENGKWVVFPTIVKGKRLSEDEAWDKLKTGENKSVGSFDTLEESEDYATKRSQEIGKVREKDRVKKQTSEAFRK